MTAPRVKLDIDATREKLAALGRGSGAFHLMKMGVVLTRKSWCRLAILGAVCSEKRGTGTPAGAGEMLPSGCVCLPTVGHQPVRVFSRARARSRRGEERGEGHLRAQRIWLREFLLRVEATPSLNRRLRVSELLCSAEAP